MMTFDLAEVRGFVADLDTRMTRCQNGEGMECATLDAALRHHAALCREFSDEVRRWGREVFAGRVAFDPEVERVWLTEGRRLYARVMDMYAHAPRAETSCQILEGQAILAPVLLGLDRLIKGWVTPRLAVGPSARRRLTLEPSVAEEAHRRIESLPPLPADWKPDDPRQRAMYQRLRTSPGHSDAPDLPFGRVENGRAYNDPPHADPHRDR